VSIKVRIIPTQIPSITASHQGKENSFQLRSIHHPLMRAMVEATCLKRSSLKAQSTSTLQVNHHTTKNQNQWRAVYLRSITSQKEIIITAQLL
jgi:hypothetical protein